MRERRLLTDLKESRRIKMKRLALMVETMTRSPAEADSKMKDCLISAPPVETGGRRGVG